jgi:FkbM family methyltransferase
VSGASTSRTRLSRDQPTQEATVSHGGRRRGPGATGPSGLEGHDAAARSHGVREEIRHEADVGPRVDGGLPRIGEASEGLGDHQVVHPGAGHRPPDRIWPAVQACAPMTSIMARRVGPEGRVITFEPQPDVFARLESNIETWRDQDPSIGEVSPHRLALSDVAATRSLHVPADRDDNHERASLREFKFEHRSIEVQTKRLDEVALPEGAIALLKIDTERHELEVLRGAHLTLPAVRTVGRGGAHGATHPRKRDPGRRRFLPVHRPGELQRAQASRPGTRAASCRLGSTEPDRNARPRRARSRPPAAWVAFARLAKPSQPAAHVEFVAARR